MTVGGQSALPLFLPHMPPPMDELIITIQKPRRKLDPGALLEFSSRAQGAIRLRGTVSVLITGNAQMQRLNRVFRRKNKATDVLSFPGAVRGVAGDIAISADIAAANAKAFGHTLQQEIQILLLHGMLHLAGYDHENDAGEMSRKEASLRKRLGLPTSLISRAQESKKVRPVRKQARRKTA